MSERARDWARQICISCYMLFLLYVFKCIKLCINISINLLTLFYFNSNKLQFYVNICRNSFRFFNIWEWYGISLYHREQTEWHFASVRIQFGITTSTFAYNWVHQVTPRLIPDSLHWASFKTTVDSNTTDCNNLVPEHWLYLWLWFSIYFSISTLMILTLSDMYFSLPKPWILSSAERRS